MTRINNLKDFILLMVGTYHVIVRDSVCPLCENKPVEVVNVVLRREHLIVDWHCYVDEGVVIGTTRYYKSLNIYNFQDCEITQPCEGEERIQLAKKEKDCLALKLFTQKSRDQIADIINNKPSTIDTYLRRAREKFQVCSVRNIKPLLEKSYPDMCRDLKRHAESLLP
tara:strand:- start:65145 stop:65648 length:504 start_codon:yes stop_codon:yes gene_type:complete